MTETQKAKLEGALWMARYFAKQHSDWLCSINDDTHKRWRYEECDMEQKYNVAYWLENMISGEGFVYKPFEREVLSDGAVIGWDKFYSGEEE